MGKHSAARVFGLTIAAIALAVAPVAGAAVYRCTQAGGKVLYTDSPCKGGAVVDVRAGTADPIAIDRLDRENAAFDRNMAARAAIEQKAAAQRQELYLRRQELEATQSAAAASAAAAAAPGYVPAYGFPARFARPHARPARPPIPIAPPPPRSVPAEIRRPHPG